MRVAVVTGSAKGLGRALAVALAKQGYVVVVHYRSSSTDAKKVFAQVQRYSPRSMLVQADLTQTAQVQKVFTDIKRCFKKIDVLINTVGDFGPYQPLSQWTLRDWEQVIQSNIYTVALCTQYAAPLLRQSRSGRIINFSCASAEYGLARRYTAPYYIAKQGVLTLTKSWAELLAPKITVNSISPGILSSSTIKPTSASRQIVSFNAIISAVQFLLSPAASEISGANLEVSRGWRPRL